MKISFKCLLVLLYGLYAVQAKSAERLGRISDETAPPANQAEQAVDREGSIVYRVICSPEGEMLPECGQQPVSDSFKVAQPPKTGPEIPDLPVGDETSSDASAQEGNDDQADGIVEPIAPKKAVEHKKRGKKSVKKPSKKTAKSAKKRKRP